jgi:hypothetical protein
LVFETKKTGDQIMRDVFGADGIQSDGATAAPPMPSMAATVPAPVPVAAVAAAAAPTGPTPTLKQAVDKAVSKASADATVAADPNATHHVKLAPLAPQVVGSTGTMAAAGFLFGGPVGAAIGAGAGWLMSRYQIAGDPVHKVWLKVKSKIPTNLTGAAATK